MRPIHILNGDALAEQLPADLEGQRIIMRECLMDGEISALEREAFYRDRWQYLDQLTDGLSFEEYQQKTVSQLEAISKLSAGNKAFLWFEKDLFCQVNLWFCLHLLVESGSVAEIYLVKPDERSPYSFAFYTQEALMNLFHQAKRLNDPSKWSKLWTSYRDKDWPALEKYALSMANDYPFVLKAVQAHLARLEREDNLGRPMEMVLALLREGKSFAEVFQAMWATEGIYGYGDLQVKGLYDRALSLIEAE